MKTIKNIILNINDLEKDFSLLNSRIIEFWESTKNQHIDTILLKEYINSLENYEILLTKYKKSLEILISDKMEFKSEKELMLFRIKNLGIFFKNNLAKLNIILDSTDIVEKKDIEINVDFNSLNEAISIKKDMYDFYNIYNKNIEYQEKYDIKIDLDDWFEDRIEKKLKTNVFLKEEIKYLKDLNKIFQEVESINNIFWEKFEELYNHKDKFQNKPHLFERWLFPKWKDSFVWETFNQVFKKEYTNSKFDITNSKIIKDLLIFKKKINKSLNLITFLIDYSKFSDNYLHFHKLNLKYKIFDNISLIEKINYFYLNIFSLNDFSNPFEIKDFSNKKFLNELWNWFNIIKKSIKIFNTMYSIIKNYDIIFNDKSNDLIYWMINNIYAFIKIEKLTTEKYIINWAKNILNKFNINIKIWETQQKTINTLKENIINLSHIDTDFNKLISLIKNINESISWIKYSPWKRKSSYTSKVKNLTKKLNSLLWQSNKREQRKMD